jgi:fibronectin type 3 domain-containing protein
VAGYRVYRRETGSADWVRIGPELVREAAFRDLKVAPGRGYMYRVTAVSTAGNESAPSGEVTETAASQ